MNRSLSLIALGLLLGLTACSSPKPAVVPPPAPVEVPPKTDAPQPTAPVAPVKSTTPDLAAACDVKASPPDRMAGLLGFARGAVKGTTAAEAAETLTRGQRGCVNVEAGENLDLLLLTAREGFALGPSAIAWLDGGSWQFAPVWEDAQKKSFGYFLFIGTARMTGGKPEAFLEARTGGSGGWVGLFHVKVLPDGTAVTTDTRTGFGRGGVSFLSFDLVLASYRDKLYELIPDCNGCVPSSEQALIKWDGQRFTSVANRIAVDPEVALNLLYYYLGTGDLAKAGQYAANPGVLEQAKAVTLPDGGWYDLGPTHDHVDFRESRAWSAIPPEFRTTLAPVERVFTTVIQTKNGSVPVHFSRQEDGWVVERFDLLGTPPATLAEVTAALSDLQAARPESVADPLKRSLFALQHYLRTSSVTEAFTHPLLRVIPVPSQQARLVHLGDQAFAKQYGLGWTWVAWLNRVELIHAGDSWAPKLLAPMGIQHFAVVWESPLEPGAQRITLYGLVEGRWKNVGTDWAFYEDLKKGGFEAEIDVGEVTLSGKDGARFEPRPDGKGFDVCKPGGTCLQAQWVNGKYQPKK